MPDLDRRRLAAEGASRLQELLPQEWDFRITPFDPGNQGLDLQVTVQSPQGVYNELLVEARSRVTPLAAREIGAERRRVKTWARGPQATHVVVAPWLSRSTQQILREGEVGYLDLTGNVYLRISNPAVFVRTDGAARDPNPGPADERRALSGVKAGRLVRVLVDSAPPARPTELARAIELSLPYVGRLLTALEEQGLIRWGRRGVDEVDWQALLRTRAEQSAPLLRPGTGVTLLAPRGVDRLLDTVRDQLPDQLLITGFYAAAAITPIAVGGQLLLYPVGPVLGHPEALAVRLEDVGGLLPTTAARTSSC